MNDAAETVYDSTDPAQLARLVRQEHLLKLDIAVYRLTQHYVTRVVQRPIGGGRKETVVRHLPLIDMLVTAATSKSGASETGSAASGMVLNVVAFQKIEDLKKHTRAAWLSLIPGGNQLIDSFRYTPTNSLNLWYQTFTAPHNRRRVGATTLAAATVRWTDWTNLIDVMFDPQPVSEFMNACPSCRVEYLITGDNERVRAVAISFKTVMAICRNCGETWSGASDFVRLKNNRNPYTTHRSSAKSCANQF